MKCRDLVIRPVSVSDLMVTQEDLKNLNLMSLSVQNETQKQADYISDFIYSSSLLYLTQTSTALIWGHLSALRPIRAAGPIPLGDTEGPGQAGAAVRGAAGW